ncbi:Ribonuclease H2, subunit B [Cinara cedri]|uniref:Ribonuclease H2, subunit B n=1 Tax=Cinara cedri TaxID=506608 RepID=A0A5E4NIC5_9HEMI|nr:Ribonuclease H2, subunit B [Cinara cedri]
MTRKSKKEEKFVEQESTVELNDKYRFLILPDTLTKDQNIDKEFIKLRHPQTGQMALFLYSENEKKLAQMRSLPFSHRSFFKESEVIPINRIDFVTLVDPLFIFLPYLVKCSSMFSPLDQILMDEELPELNNLLMKLSTLTNIQQVADMKECADLTLWQYSEKKTLDWLSPKVENVSQVLITRQINVNPNAAVSTSFKLSDTKSIAKEHYTRYAFSLISEYLPIDVQKSLLKHLGLPEKVECNKRKAGGSITDVNKKVKHSDNHDDEKPYKVEKVVIPKISAKDKALKKAASGTRSISSFFIKK